MTTAEYVKVLTEVQCYLAPKMAATALSGPDGAPMAVTTLDVTQLMANPQLAEAAPTIGVGNGTEASPDRSRAGRS